MPMNNASAHLAQGLIVLDRGWRSVGKRTRNAGSIITAVEPEALACHWVWPPKCYARADSTLSDRRSKPTAVTAAESDF